MIKQTTQNNMMAWGKVPGTIPQRFVFSVLMTIVMMAMSPQKTWADSQLTYTATSDLSKLFESVFGDGGTWTGKDTPVKITISGTVTSIGENAFSRCPDLTSITIPEGVTSIGKNAFNECYQLETISIPSTVTSVGEGAFFGTTWYENKADGLVYIGKALYEYKGVMPENTAIELKSNTKSITTGAFFCCSGLTSITIPEGVTSIGDNVFSGCSDLTTVTVLSNSLTLGKGAFDDCNSLQNIYLPAGSVATYKAATNWSSYADKIKAIPDPIPSPFNVTITKDGEQSAAVSKNNATLITINNNAAGKPQVTVKSGANDANPASATFDHNVRYNFDLTAVTTIEPNTQNINGNVVAGAKRRVPTAQTPTITGPALVLEGATGSPYYLTDQDITLALSSDGKYVVNGSEVEGTVTSVYFYSPRTEVTGGIIWDDNNDQDGKRPTSVTVNLLADGTQKGSKTVTASDNWQYSFTDLPKYNSGQEIAYTISAADVTDYTSSVSGNNVTLAHTPETISVSGTIIWDDNNDLDEKRPASVTVKVFVGETQVGDDKTVSASDNWQFSFTDLPKYNAGQEIAYTISAADVTDYTKSVSGNNVTLTHTHTHVYATDYTVDVEATCTTDGSKSKHCTGTGCDSKTDETTIPALGHDFTAKTLTENADANGLYSYVCSRDAAHLSDDKVVKGLGAGNIELTVTGEGASATYTTTSTIALTDDSKIDGLKVAITTTTAPTYTRSVDAAYTWGTVVLPFEIKSDDAVQLFAIGSKNSDGLVASPVTTVAANTPCIYKKKDASATSVVFTANSNTVSVSEPVTTTAVDGFVLKGTYVEKASIVGSNVYYISKDQFWCASTDGVKVPAFRGWLVDQNGQGAKSLGIFVEGGMTGISEVNAESLELREGKYLENGRIVIVKNGKKYTAAGFQMN